MENFTLWAGKILHGFGPQAIEGPFGKWLKTKGLAVWPAVCSSQIAQIGQPPKISRLESLGHLDEKADKMEQWELVDEWLSDIDIAHSLGKVKVVGGYEAIVRMQRLFRDRVMAQVKAFFS